MKKGLYLSEALQSVFPLFRKDEQKDWVANDYPTREMPPGW
jgi:hypothetical protein